MVPAASASFWMLWILVSNDVADDRHRPVAVSVRYAVLGALGGPRIHAGELPNSFVKRQLDIAPGSTHREGADRRRPSRSPWIGFDSILGMLLAVSLAAPRRG
jgi:hypothetical protein